MASALGPKLAACTPNGLSNLGYALPVLASWAGNPPGILAVAGQVQALQAQAEAEASAAAAGGEAPAEGAAAQAAEVAV